MPRMGILDPLLLAPWHSVPLSLGRGRGRGHAEGDSKIGPRHYFFFFFFLLSYTMIVSKMGSREQGSVKSEVNGRAGGYT